MYKQVLVELLPIVLAGLPGSSRLEALLTQKQWLKLDQLAQQFSNLLLYASKVEGGEGLWRLAVWSELVLPYPPVEPAWSIANGHFCLRMC